MNTNGAGPADPPTVEILTADIERLRKVLELCRQQRDQFAALANDLQVELAIARQPAPLPTPPPELVLDEREKVDAL